MRRSILTNIYSLVWVLVAFFAMNALAFAADKVVIIPLFKSKQSDEKKLIFVTNGTWTGNLGGLAGADAKCNTEANSRRFSGTFQALLGSAAGIPFTRSIGYPVEYVNVTKGQIQSNFYNLFSGGIVNPVKPGSGLGATWTGLNGDGSRSNVDCNSWTTESGLANGTVGLTNVITSNWLNTADAICSNLIPLYCIEQ